MTGILAIVLARRERTTVKDLQLVFPCVVSVPLLCEAAPLMLSSGSATEVFEKLDRHTRLGSTERRRHNSLCNLVASRLPKRTETIVNVPIFALKGTSNVKKRSRRVDIISIDKESRRCSLIEITVVRDETLASRIDAKLEKYSDLQDDLASSEWYFNSQSFEAVLKVLPIVRAAIRGIVEIQTMVIAVGVFGTVPESTAYAVRALIEGPTDEFVRDIQSCVLDVNLKPFIATSRRSEQ